VERVEIGEALGGFLSENKSEYKNKGLTVTFAKESTKLFAYIDVLQFRNVLHNVLGNSVKYKTDDTVKTKIEYSEADDNIVISITDDGPGVPAGSLDKLFDVFYRDDDSRNEPSGGSGLGLAIARKIVEQLGGTIKAENVPDGGLSIIIALPKTGGAA
jgi:signal transduction histidine kinase